MSLFGANWRWKPNYLTTSNISTIWLIICTGLGITTYASEEEKTALDEKYCFDYKYKDDVEKEIKINVTSLSKEKNKYRIEKLLTYSEYIDKSHFSPEKIGTLNHMFLQHIDFEKSYTLEDLKNQLI